jgi:hypothetical protein
MAIELKIDGYFEMSFKDLAGLPVDKATEKEILKNLQSGDYIIGLNSKMVVKTEEFLVPIYSFELEPTDNSDYEYESLEETQS